MAANSPIALRPFVLAEIDLNDAASGLRITPLAYAARNGFADVVRFLIESGAEVHQTDYQGLTAIDHALARGHRRIAQMLQEATSTDVLQATLPA